MHHDVSSSNGLLSEIQQRECGAPEERCADLVLSVLRLIRTNDMKDSIVYTKNVTLLTERFPSYALHSLESSTRWRYRYGYSRRRKACGEEEARRESPDFRRLGSGGVMCVLFLD